MKRDLVRILAVLAIVTGALVYGAIRLAIEAEKHWRHA